VNRESIPLGESVHGQYRSIDETENDSEIAEIFDFFRGMFDQPEEAIENSELPSAAAVLLPAPSLDDEFDAGAMDAADASDSDSLSGSMMAALKRPVTRNLFTTDRVHSTIQGLTTFSPEKIGDPVKKKIRNNDWRPTSELPLFTSNPYTMHGDRVVQEKPPPLLSQDQQLGGLLGKSSSRTAVSQAGFESPPAATSRASGSTTLSTAWSSPGSERSIQNRPREPSTMSRISKPRLSENLRLRENPLWHKFTCLRGERGGLLAQQFAMDEFHDQYTPRLQEWESEETPMGVFELGTRVHVGRETTVFEERRTKSTMIKYQINLKNKTIHPLLNDFWYMTAAFRLGLAPQPLFISPPTILGVEVNKKTQFKMTTDERSTAVSSLSAVRYMISRKVAGESIHRARRHYEGGSVDFLTSMHVGIMLISSLEKLHQVNIVHGDIHSGNIMVDFVPDSAMNDQRIQFIDFGTSFRIERPQSNDRVNSRFANYHHMFTYWTIEGFEISKRDDLNRAVHAIASLMNKNDYLKFETELMHDRDAYMDWKTRGFWFHTPSTGFDPIDVIPRISAETKTRIRSALAQVLDIARSANDINESLDYYSIIDLFRECATLAMPSSPVGRITPLQVV